jgi:hypothetical protein
LIVLIVYYQSVKLMGLKSLFVGVLAISHKLEDAQKAGNKKSPSVSEELFGRVKGVEPPRLAALDPKSSVSTNSTTPAKWSANINQFSDLQMHSP